MIHLGIDMGTTAVKAVVTNKDLQVLKTWDCSYPTFYDGDKATQNIQDIITIVDEIIAQAKSEFTVNDMALSCAMHSVILLNDSLEVISDLLIWSDSRAKDVVDEFLKRDDALDIYQRTGTAIHPMNPFMKLMWFKEQGQLNADVRVGDLKSVVFHHLTGEFAVDKGIASATGLYNTDTMSYDEVILDILELSDDALPRVEDGRYKLSLQSDESIEVYLGGSDGGLANIYFDPEYTGNGVCNAGTSGAYRRIAQVKPRTSKQDVFNYIIDDNAWIVGYASNNCGNVLDWMLAGIAQDYTLSECIDIYKERSECDRPYFLPFVYAERGKDWNYHKTQEFVGLLEHHTLEDKIASIVEGVLFNLASLADISEENEVINITGGLFKEPFFRQIYADCTQRKLRYITEDFASALGVIAYVKKYTQRSNESIDIFPQKANKRFLKFLEIGA